jgi:hypothetical protein
MKLLFVTIASIAALMTVSGAQAQSSHVHYTATLDGKDEVPANSSAGTGKLVADLDPATGAFTYSVTYQGLTGPATMAHFHGPAVAGANAPPVIVVKDPANPISGKEVLTPDQMAVLAQGKWYFNVHTKAHPTGEIRGQVTAQ